MTYYRVYSLNRDGRHIIDVDDFSADNDIAAMGKIRTDPTGACRELWTLGRKVKEFARLTDAEIHLLAAPQRLTNRVIDDVAEVIRATDNPETGAEQCHI